MTKGITYCMDNPVRSSVSEWLNTYIGRISVGRRTGVKKEIEILAYSDNEDDSSSLREMAKKEGALYIRSLESEGVTAID